MRRKTWTWALGAFCATALPAIVPLALIHHYYCSDWLLHLWPSGFNAVYFRHHLTIPPEINAAGAIAGFPNHPFYGYLLYSIAGVLGAFTGGGEQGLRLACALAFIVQFVLVYQAARRVSDSAPWGAFTAALVTTAIYPLTNLYHRAAVAEFFTGCFLTSALCCWVILLHARDRRTILVYAPWLAMSLANMGGSHPITSVYSVLILTPLFLLALPKYRELPPKLRGTFWAAVAFALVFATLVDLASAYMLAKFSPLVGASRSGGLFLVRSDAWWMRFFPLPFDKGSLIHGTHIDTAYLELQLNMPLLFTAGLAAALARVRRSSPLAPFLAGAAVAFPVLAFFSLSTLPWHFVPKLLQLIQFPYRLISYCNLMLLAILLAALSAGREKLARKPGERTLIALVAVATLMFCGFAIKLVHVGATKTSKVAVGAPSDPSEQEVYKDFAFYAHYTLFGLPELKKAEVAASKWVELPLGGIGPEYGFIKPVSVSVPNGGWVRTSLAAFTWNKLFVDGKEVAPPALLVHGSRYAVKLAPGEHVLSASIVPDPTWLLLRSISFVTLALGTLLCFVSLFRGVSPARS